MINDSLNTNLPKNILHTVTDYQTCQNAVIAERKKFYEQDQISLSLFGKICSGCKGKLKDVIKEKYLMFREMRRIASVYSPFIKHVGCKGRKIRVTHVGLPKRVRKELEFKAKRYNYEIEFRRPRKRRYSSLRPYRQWQIRAGKAFQIS